MDKRSGVLVLIPDAMVGRLPADGVLELEAAQEPAVRRRLPKAQGEELRLKMLAIISSHPTLQYDAATLADHLGLTPKTVRAWLAEAREKYAAQPEEDE